MQIDGRTIFLLDGAGALVSAALLGLVLPALHPVVGMPRAILWGLAGVAVLYAVYSFACFRWADHADPRFLRGIALANGLYCVATLTCVGLAWQEITALGVAYFVGEVIVIAALFGWEWRIAGAVAEL